MEELIEKIIADYQLRNVLKDESYFETEKAKLILMAAFIEFGKKVCELQKQECANNARTEWVGDFYEIPENTIIVNRESILNTKNVCNEH